MALISLSWSWSAGFTETQLHEQETRLAGETAAITALATEVAARPIPAAPTQNAYIHGPDAVLVDLYDVPEYSGVFTIVIGVAKREQIWQLREQLALEEKPAAGWVLLDTNLEA